MKPGLGLTMGQGSQPQHLQGWHELAPPLRWTLVLAEVQASGEARQAQAACEVVRSCWRSMNCLAMPKAMEP